MAVQRNIIQKFMRTLNYTVNSDITQLLDAAVVSCRGKYTNIQTVIKDCTDRCVLSKSYTDFLKKDCGIDLDNEELGALVGFDTSGYTSMLIRNIISMDKISEFSMPSSNTVKYNMLEVQYPTFSGLTVAQRFIIGALHTWWIPRAIYLMELSIGYNFNYVDATPKVLKIEFTTEPVDVLAHIDYSFDTTNGKTTSLTLKINMAVYDTILDTDPNGVTSTYGDTIPSLDITTTYELVKAVEAANIDYFSELDTNYKWFVEGSKKLVRGIDDKIRENIVILASDHSRLAKAFTSSPVDKQDVGSAGYILLRFFAKQLSEFYNIEYDTKRHLMVERGRVKTLKELGEKFLTFAQRSNNMVQSWELLDDRLSSFFGATLRVPMKNWHDSTTGDRYYLYTSIILQKQTGSIYNNFIDILRLKYPLALVSDNYSVTAIDDVSTLMSTNKELNNKSHVIFSGCELSLAKGDIPYTVLTELKNIVKNVNNIGARPSILLTPIEEMYSGGKITDNYKQLLRNSYLSRKINMVCLGDSITAFKGGWSWTDYCQENLPKSYIINKGVENTTVSQALARFTTDVIEQMPDLCFILVGEADMWNADSADLDTVKTNWKKLVDGCIENNITPIIGLYTPTQSQVDNFITTLPSGAHKDKVQIQYNFRNFYTYCCKVAEEYNLITVNVYSSCKDVNAKIDLENVCADGINLSQQGAEKMGYYIANELAEFIWDKQSQLHQDYDIINIYDIFCKNLGVNELSQTDLESLLDEEKKHYKDGDTLDYITNYIYGNEILVPFKRAYFYVSFEHMNVTEQTYANWLRTGHQLDNYEEYIAHIKSDEYSDFRTRIYYQSEKYNHSIDYPSVVRHVFGKYGSTDRENAFKNTGEFLAVGLHTTFDKNIWMCEQGGITCTKEATEQINDLNLLGWRSSVTDRQSGDTNEGGEVQLPVFPGTGCPWFTLSDKNKADFEIDTYGIDYWFTKSNCDATITFKVKNVQQGYDIYQSISLGMMSNVPNDSYMFPLYIAGGNQALSQDIYVYVPIKGKYPTYKVGNIYDLDIQNICLSNSNLLHPAKFYNANMSNFRILSPEGEWKDIYSCSQGAQVKAYHYCSGPTLNWGVGLLDPVFDGNLYHSAVPFMSDIRHKIDTYTVNKPLNQYESSSMLDRIVINLKRELPHHEVGIEGMIPNCYHNWYRYMSIGEISIKNKRYLSIPSGWDNRLWKYPWVIGVCNSTEFWENTQVQSLDDLYSRYLPNVIIDRLMIPLEEEDD